MTSSIPTTVDAAPAESEQASAPRSDREKPDAFAVVVNALRGNRAETGALFISSKIDWESVAEVANRHRVVPQLLAALHTTPAGEQASRILQAKALRIAQRNLDLTRELLSVLAELRARGVTAVPYKGPALAQQLFGSIALRQMSDVDILVLPRDAAAASDALLSTGYRIEPPAGRVPRGAYMRHASEYSFRKPGADVDVELHWRVLPPSFPFTVDLAGMFARTRDVDLCGSSVAVFAPEDLLVLLSLHGLKHLFFQLRWICDIAQLLKQGVDWPIVVERAKQARATRTVLLAATVAHELLDAPLPAVIVDHIAADAEIAKLAAEVPAYLRDPDAENRPGRHRFYARALSGPRDRAVYALRTLTGPTEAEWGTAKLPGPLYPLYRIGRLAAKAVRGRTRGER
jgi:hypothetical protein